MGLISVNVNHSDSLCPRVFMPADELSPHATEDSRNMNVNQPPSNRQRIPDVHHDHLAALAICLQLAFLRHCFSRPAISL